MFRPLGLVLIVSLFQRDSSVSGVWFSLQSPAAQSLTPQCYPGSGHQHCGDGSDGPGWIVIILSIHTPVLKYFIVKYFTVDQ